MRVDDFITEQERKEYCASCYELCGRVCVIYRKASQRYDQAEREEQYTPTTKNDLALIHTNGLDEGIRCAMCTNSMKSDRGCDGSCVVNNGMYKAVMETIEKHIQPTTENDLVDAKPVVINKIKDECSCPHCGKYLFDDEWIYTHTDYKYCPYCGEKIIVGGRQ